MDLTKEIYGNDPPAAARAMIDAMGFEESIQFVCAQAERILKEKKSNENPIIADIPVRSELVNASIAKRTKR